MEDDEVDPLAAVDLQSLSLNELPTDESTRLMDIIPISKSWYNKIIIEPRHVISNNVVF